MPSKRGKNRRGRKNQRPSKAKRYNNAQNNMQRSRFPKKYYGVQPKPRYDKSQLCLSEIQVGITEYVNKKPVFTAVLKSRYSDFQVNEIDMDGKVLHLNDMDVPQPPEEILDAEELANAKKQFDDIITADCWERIDALANTPARAPGGGDVIDINVATLDKEKRTQIHNLLKHLYGHRVISTTVNLNDQVADRYVRIAKPKGNPGEYRKKWTFPGEYVHFLLYKENMQTSDAAFRIADGLRLHASKVNYCGTKDKRGKTTQKFSIRRKEPSAIIKAIHFPQIKVGNFTFSNNVLKLGELKGNRFRITLRQVNGVDQDIEEALEQLREKGFINYFGLQRFGMHSEIPTYVVGVALLKADYKTAAELILKPREGDRDWLAKIRKMWWKNRDSAAAAAKFRTDHFIEKKLLDGLAQYGENDYAAALRKIPRNTLLLYPHAFQSIVFNRIASRRIQKFGLELMPGDLVYRNAEELEKDLIEMARLESLAEEKESEKGANADGENNEEDEEDDNENTEKTDMPEVTEDAADATAIDAEVKSAYKRKVKALTEEDIASGEYTIFDVVLPLPGYDVTYPENELATWYEEILQEYGLTSETLRHKVKTYSMPGTYRKLMILPTDFTWKFCNYNNPEETLVLSDWDIIKGKLEKDMTGEGNFKALILDFCLPPSVYATMLLRELLKSDTSSANQIRMENNATSEAMQQNEDEEGEGYDDDDDGAGDGDGDDYGDDAGEDEGEDEGEGDGQDEGVGDGEFEYGEPAGEKRKLHSESGEIAAGEKKFKKSN